MNILIPGTNVKVISGERKKQTRSGPYPSVRQTDLWFWSLQTNCCICTISSSTQEIHTWAQCSLLNLKEEIHNLENKIRFNRLSFVSHGMFPAVSNTLFCNEFPISWWPICSSQLRKRYVSKPGTCYQQLQIRTIVQTVENSLWNWEVSAT